MVLMHSVRQALHCMRSMGSVYAVGCNIMLLHRQLV